MYKKREFTKAAYYHVTSRTNDKIRVFENNLGRKIMLMVLQDAKAKFHFNLANFCIMPTHIHLLIQPPAETDLSKIMHWIKLQSAKRWNNIHGSIDHVWGQRYYAGLIKDRNQFDFVMDYIDQNAVVVGLSETPEAWKASGAYYKSKGIEGLVDFTPYERPPIKLLSPIPPEVAKLLPPAQLNRISMYYGAHAEAVDRLYKIVKSIPGIGETPPDKPPKTYLHYFAETADYFISEYDGEDTLWGKVRFKAYHPSGEQYQKFSLSNLKSNQSMEMVSMGLHFETVVSA